ncbi:MAG: hypothetical protein H6Q17_2408 [Bacteroidetes bacterium]|nr:hypothetical protein [Bacteroidota bacterium]
MTIGNKRWPCHFTIKLLIMLKKILSVSGKPGLFKLISQGKNMMIIESLVDKKRCPALAHDRVVSLGDISIYTETEEMPLSAVFANIKEKETGNKASIDPKADGNTLRAYFEEVVPEFDKDRVHTSDIKKIIIWYNLLVENELTGFAAADAEEEKDTEA